MLLKQNSPTIAGLFNNKVATKTNVIETCPLNNNVTHDLNKSLFGCSYNCLNLPTSMTGSPIVINYTYDANGTKFNYRDFIGTESYDYIDPFYFENGTLSHIFTSEDRVVRDDNGDFDYYEYHMKDHLGNTRVVFNEDDGILQTTYYFPFEMIA